MRRAYRIVKRRILFEMGADEPHEYASTHAVPPEDIAELVKKAQGAIDQKDLHDDGFGPPPHITILYGLGDEDKETALEILRSAGPVKARVSGVDLFQNDENDVVIFAVESEDLARLRDEIDKAVPDNMNSWSDYKPHMTVAYVLPGKGAMYKDLESELVGREFDLDALEFSGTDDDVERIDLKPATQQLPEESPLFGTDILAGEDPGTEESVRKALYPVLNRSNRRIVSIAEDDSGVNVLLDNGQNLVVNRGPDAGPRGSWLVTHNGEQFDTADLAALEDLVKRLSSPTTEQVDEPPDWKSYDAPPEPLADADAPPEEPKPKRRRTPRVPQSTVAVLTNDGYNMVLNVDQPTGTARGRRFDRVEQVINILSADPMVSVAATPRRASVSSVTIDIHDRTPRQFGIVANAIDNVLRSNRFNVRNTTRAPKPTVWQRIRGKGEIKAEDVAEDTYTSDVGFTDTIPVMKTRRRKVKRPGLTNTPKKRRTKRRYKVKESMSKGTSPILIVLRPQQVEALSAKPVWSALQESGVISTKSFRMGEEDFFEVSIDTLRKEWSQANAGVLLDEVGSIDPRIQRKVMEHIDVDKLYDAVWERIPTWCATVPVDVAVKESESFAEAHRTRRLEGKTIDEEWVEEALAKDSGVVRSVLEWYDLSREVLDRLASVKNRAYEHVSSAARRLLEQETTDPSAGVGGNSGGMPTANAGAATIQGYSEEEPEGVSVSSRNWPAQGMFKIHVLVGESPQWVYRQVVGHEGEGEQSMIVYRTPEGRVMRMPHEQIDAASGFGAVVTPEELSGAEPGEQPMPAFQQSPEPPAEPPAEQLPVGEQVDPNQEKLTRDANFGRALAKYQQSKDARDWEDVRAQAGRATGLKGPELDAVLAPMGAEKEERRPMYGGAREDIMPPVIDEDEELDEGKIPPQFLSKLDNKKAKADRGKKKDGELDEREKKTKQVKGRKVKEPTHMRALAKKAGVGMDRAMTAWGEAQGDFEKAHPEVKKRSDRYYKGVTGYFKKKIGIGSGERESVDEDVRQAEAVRLFSSDDRFHEFMDKFEATRNEGYLIRATERASRVAGIPLNEARNLVDEILKASKQTA